MPRGPRARAIAEAGASSAAKDFGKEVRAALTKRGIRFVGTTWLPDEKGSFANGSRGYLLDDNGTGRVRDYRGVLSLAGY
jgi:hypothetical protein